MSVLFSLFLFSVQFIFVYLMFMFNDKRVPSGKELELLTINLIKWWWCGAMVQSVMIENMLSVCVAHSLNIISFGFCFELHIYLGIIFVWVSAWYMGKLVIRVAHWRQTRLPTAAVIFFILIKISSYLSADIVLITYLNACTYNAAHSKHNPISHITFIPLLLANNTNNRFDLSFLAPSN